MKPSFKRDVFKLLLEQVKSAGRKVHLPGIAAFCGMFPVKRQLLVGAQGIPLEEFLRRPALEWAH